MAGHFHFCFVTDTESDAERIHDCVLCVWCQLVLQITQEAHLSKFTSLTWIHQGFGFYHEELCCLLTGQVKFTDSIGQKKKIGKLTTRDLSGFKSSCSNVSKPFGQGINFHYVCCSIFHHTVELEPELKNFALIASENDLTNQWWFSRMHHCFFTLCRQFVPIPVIRERKCLSSKGSVTCKLSRVNFPICSLLLTHMVELDWYYSSPFPLNPMHF